MKILTIIIIGLSAFSQPAVSKEILQVAFSGPQGNSVLDSAAGIEAWRNLWPDSTVVPKPSLPNSTFMMSYTVEVHVGHAGQTAAINVYRYVPSNDDSPAYLFFADVRGGWSGSVGSWFMLADDADSEVKKLIQHRELIE